MAVFETNAEDLAYEKGFQHGEESGKWISKDAIIEEFMKHLCEHGSIFEEHEGADWCYCPAFTPTEIKNIIMGVTK